MAKVWLIQLFWLLLALPGYAVLRRWDRDSLQRGFLFALGRCYLASLIVLTPASVLGYWQHWPLWSLSVVYVAGVVLGAWCLLRDRRALAAGFRLNWLAAIGGMLFVADLWMGLRAGAHTQGDAGYHIARVRMLIEEGLSNWDPIVAQQRLDIIYHTNIYHALIAVSGQLTGSDAGLAWLATWPFAKLLAALGVAQLACSVFGAARYGWLASLALLAAQCAYSALPFPNTLAPLALLPMGLCAGAELLAGARGSPLAAAWLAASAIALAQVHALNAIFLAMLVGPILLAVLVLRLLRRAAPPQPRKRRLALGLAACSASLPWLLVPGWPRIQVLLLLAAPTLQGNAPLPQPKAAVAQHVEPSDQTPPAADGAPHKGAYKAERFRKLPNGMSVYDPGQLRGLHDIHVVALAALLVTLALRPRRQLGALAAFVTLTCAWLLVPPFCSVLLFVTGAPWAALRIVQVLPVAACVLLPGALLSWTTHVARLRAWQTPLQLGSAAVAVLIGAAQMSHGEPWTGERYWQHAREHEALTQWQSMVQKRELLCTNLPPHAIVMAHPRWDYGLPMHCRNFAVALGPTRGWHGMPYMQERRAHVDEFFRDNTSAERRLALLRKYATRYVFTTVRTARKIVASLPKTSRILGQSRVGAVVAIDL
jgi:hypothetical protein